MISWIAFAMAAGVRPGLPQCLDALRGSTQENIGEKAAAMIAEDSWQGVPDAPMHRHNDNGQCPEDVLSFNAASNR
jgi:hypothetical protein